MREKPLTQPVDAVVIGASSGGVEAISTLLSALPSRLRAPIFIVLHMPRDRPSGLVELLRAKCASPIEEAQDKEPIKTGTIYIAPPDYHLLIDSHLLVDTGPQLALSYDQPVNYSRPSIDCLFESAADVYGKRLLGIILTGANEDGALGLAAIKSAGGSAIVQCPETAQMPTMPAAAIKQVQPDLVTTLPAIAELMANLLSSDS